ncbi:MAG: exosortase-associated EpsI family protein [Candidatus Riflebacteria bacterium]|nr:exosortase-associated EpsI family protein [Candidatus Riflebacteria bacterium]
MGRNKIQIHKVFVIILLLILTIFSLFFVSEKKNPELRKDFDKIIPRNFGGWEFIPLKTRVSNEKTSFLSEIYEAKFRHPKMGEIFLTIEFGSDSRKKFQLHMPHVCHRVRGDQISILDPLEVAMKDGRNINTALLDWYYPKNKAGALCSYWLIIADKAYSSYFQISMSQFFAGLLYRTQDSILVRIDTFYLKTPNVKERKLLQFMISIFVRDLYQSLGEKEKHLLFAEK